MALAYGTSGSGASGTTSLSVPYPASIATGDLLVLHVVNKYPTNGPDTPSGFTLVAQTSGGAGSAGVDTGTVYSAVYYKIADGTETGNLSVSIPSANASLGRMHRYTCGANKTFSLLSYAAADNFGGTSSFNTVTAVTMDLTANDVLLVASGINSDLFTYSGDTIAAAGITVWGTLNVRDQGTTANGDGARIRFVERPVTTGTASGATSFGVTTSANTTDSPAGCSLFVRMREIDAFTSLPEFSASARGTAREASRKARGKNPRVFGRSR